MIATTEAFAASLLGVLAIKWPIIAFVVVICVLAASWAMIYFVGKRILRFFRKKPAEG
jgi:hypothetical protein